jgi:hypothetical protein
MSNSRYARVQNQEGYSRDLKTNAIVSDNRSGYQEFVAKKQRDKSFADRLDNLEKTLDKILEKLDYKE